jgi:hypothetical protein
MPRVRHADSANRAGAEKHVLLSEMSEKVRCFSWIRKNLPADSAHGSEKRGGRTCLGLRATRIAGG